MLITTRSRAWLNLDGICPAARPDRVVSAADGCFPRPGRASGAHVRILMLRRGPRSSLVRWLSGGAALSIVAAVGVLSITAGSASADPATHLLVSMAYPSPVVAGHAAQVTVSAFGTDTSPDSTYNGVVHLSSSDTAAVLPASVTVTGGVGNAMITFNTGGTQTITATDAANLLTPGTSYPFTVSTATHLVVTAPATAVTGTAITGTVKAENASGAVDSTYSGTSNLTSSDNAAVPISVPVTITAGVGTYTFTFGTLGNQSLIAYDNRGFLTFGQTPVVVSPGSTHLVLSVPGPLKQGIVGLSTVQAEDSAGNVIATYNGTVHFTSNDPAAQLPPDLKLTAGVGQFIVVFNTASTNARLTATDTATSTITGTTGPIVVTAGSNQVSRVSGADRFSTAAQAAALAYPGGGVEAVVLARADDYPDALAGSVLAAVKGGPLLFVDGATLGSTTQTAIHSQLAGDGTVYILGGTSAVPASVATQVAKLGYKVVRYAGSDRYGTAIAIANALGDPSTVMLATGINFPDALAAGPAAAHVGGVVLLTDGTSLPVAVSQYLAAHPGKVYAVGGPAVAADPSATPLSGASRYATAVAVASSLFSAPTHAGVASGVTFPDALTGGAFEAHAGGPLLLTDPNALPPQTSSYLASVKATVDAENTFGGTAAVSVAVQNQVSSALG